MDNPLVASDGMSAHQHQNYADLEEVSVAEYEALAQKYLEEQQNLRGFGRDIAAKGLFLSNNRSLQELRSLFRIAMLDIGSEKDGILQISPYVFPFKVQQTLCHGIGGVNMIFLQRVNSYPHIYAAFIRYTSLPINKNNNVYFQIYTRMKEIGRHFSDQRIMEGRSYVEIPRSDGDIEVFDYTTKIIPEATILNAYSRSLARFEFGEEIDTFVRIDKHSGHTY